VRGTGILSVIFMAGVAMPQVPAICPPGRKAGSAQALDLSLPTYTVALECAAAFGFATGMGVRFRKEAVMATAFLAILASTLLGQAPSLWTPPGNPIPSAQTAAAPSAGGLPSPSAQPTPSYGYYSRNAERLWGPGSYDNRFGFGTRYGLGDRYGNTGGFVSPYGYGTRYGYLNRYGENPYVNEDKGYPGLAPPETGGGTIPAGDLTPFSSWGEFAPWLLGLPVQPQEQTTALSGPLAPTLYSVGPVAPAQPEARPAPHSGVLPKPVRAPASQTVVEPVKAPATQDAPQPEP